MLVDVLLGGETGVADQAEVKSRFHEVKRIQRYFTVILGLAGTGLLSRSSSFFYLRSRKSKLECFVLAKYILTWGQCYKNTAVIYHGKLPL
jgi:hypothetical protein